MFGFVKITFLSLILSISLNASDLLSKATNGNVENSNIGVKLLDNQEMKQVLGGYYIPMYENIAWGAYQTWGTIDDVHPYNGRKLILIAEKYGKDLSSGGFDIYLAYDGPIKYKETQYGRVYDVERVKINDMTLSALSYKYVDDAKDSLTHGLPGYLK